MPLPPILEEIPDSEQPPAEQPTEKRLKEKPSTSVGGPFACCGCVEGIKDYFSRYKVEVR